MGRYSRNVQVFLGCLDEIRHVVALGELVLLTVRCYIIDIIATLSKAEKYSLMEVSRISLFVESIYKERLKQSRDLSKKNLCLMC